jgi:hypothetical protein
LILLSQMKLPSTASSKTDCKKQPLLFQDLCSRKVVADFSGGILSTDGGALLLRQVDNTLGLTRRLADCFEDRRNPLFVEHAVQELISQRVFGQALGYEDLNDHNQLRRDPLMATACGKEDPLGEDRPVHAGAALAGASTLNRLELSNNRNSRCHKVPHDPKKIEALLVEMGARCVPKHAEEIIVDLDAMDHIVYGHQEGRHFHSYYDDFVYLPLYAFVGNIPIWAQLRTSDVDPIEGVISALEAIVKALRKRSPWARIIVRADCNFGRDEVLEWCERQSEVYYCVGFARNKTLLERMGRTLADARATRCLNGGATVRRFTEFEYQTKRSWSHPRRMIGKAQVSASEEDTRYVVTNLPVDGFRGEKDPERYGAQSIYEEIYCGRGEMENMLKQQVLDLKADRMSTHHLTSNQLRLWLATFAHLLMERLRATGLYGTELAQATVGSVRLKLLKVAAQIKVSVRRVYVQLSSSYPMQEIFRLCQSRLMKLPLWSD